MFLGSRQSIIRRHPVKELIVMLQAPGSRPRPQTRDGERRRGGEGTWSDLQQLHSPLGQAQSEPQLQVHPGSEWVRHVSRCQISHVRCDR
jgi:hypothetical protein